MSGCETGKWPGKGLSGQSSERARITHLAETQNVVPLSEKVRIGTMCVFSEGSSYNKGIRNSLPRIEVTQIFGEMIQFWDRRADHFSFNKSLPVCIQFVAVIAPHMR
jgi:hypothetical protein